MAVKMAMEPDPETSWVAVLLGPAPGAKEGATKEA
jgi:hypothetical protein